MSHKRPLGMNVLEAAQERIAWTFDRFKYIYVAFSGGKDSTVMLHMVMEEAKRRDRKVAVVYIDLEGQYKLTTDHIDAMYQLYAEWTEPYWVALPLHLRNAVSQYEPFWMCFDPDVKDAWIRNPPDYAITDEAYFPWFHRGMEFEEFTPAFGEWYGGDEPAAALVGIRSDESLNRWRTISNRHKAIVDGKMWTTWVGETAANVYPVYDWRTEDIWTYHAVYPEHAPNPVYEMMYRAGLTIHQARLCQPFGDDQKRGLWLYHLLEPETWGRVVARVNGANQGAMYSNETGNISGYRRVSKPDHHTWQSFAGLLLASMPERSTTHFENKVILHVKWWMERGYSEGIPDSAPYELESIRAVPSWRRICKALLRNDYWAKGLGFSQHKSRAYGQYLDLMKRRRQTDAYGGADGMVQEALELAMDL